MAIAMRHVVKFPARTFGTKGIDVSRQNGSFTFKLNYENLTSYPAVSTDVTVAFQDPATGEMGVTTLSSALNSNANIQAIANATTEADKVGYWSGESSYALTDFTAYGRTLVSSADASGARTYLNVPAISDLGTAAAADTTDFATAAQGSTADSAVQPGDLGDLATEDTVTSALLDADVFSTAHSWSGVQTFTNPVVGTQSPGDNSTKAASTAFVQDAITSSGGGDLLSTNNLSDVADADAALTNLGITSIGKAVGTAPDAGSAVRSLGGVDLSSVVSITGATTLTGSAFGKLHVISGTSANYTVTLPTPVGNGGAIIAFQVDLPASASKLYTLSTPSGVIGRQGASFIVWASETVVLRSDGTNWAVIDGKPNPMGGYLLRSTNQSVSSSFTNISYTSAGGDPSGLNLCFDSANGRIVPARLSLWVFDHYLYATQGGSPTYMQSAIVNAGTSANISGSVFAIGPSLASGTCIAQGQAVLGPTTAVNSQLRGDGTSPTLAAATLQARISYREIPTW